MSEVSFKPSGGPGHRTRTHWSNWRAIVFGHPIPDDESGHTRVSVLEGLAVLAPDAISSVAYGTQEILIVLMVLGTGALWYSLPISAVIVLLLVLLVISYRQIIAAYPNGGGAYVIGRDTLGPGVGLLAGAALLVDYTLTVSVSVSAGLAAMVAAFTILAHLTVLLSVLIIALITFLNLRGVKESARLFGPPTYLFIAMVLAMVATGLFKADPTARAFHTYFEPTASAVDLFLVLRAFSSGSSALTGIEAISNGVPIFKDPAPKLGRLALLLLAVFLGTMFFGTSIIAWRWGIVPHTTGTVLQDLAFRIFGQGVFFYVLSFVTMVVLTVAANTSFTGFPQLASIMARDSWMPRMFAVRGDRLVYQNGILVLGFFSALLIVIFGGNTDRLIPLYAVGVYLSFTIAQLSLVKKALHEKGRKRASMIVGSVGALLTALVVIVSMVTKFLQGAWIVAIAIPLLMAGFRAIRRHYLATADALRLTDLAEKPQPTRLVVVVPLATINRMTLTTLSYALSMKASEIVALNITTSDEAEARLREKWAKWGVDPTIKLEIVRSQYRSVMRPMVRYIDHLSHIVEPDRLVVLIPELLVRRPWENILHNHMAIALESVLLFRRHILVTVVPYQLPK